jgi:ATP-dependent Lon protease
MTVPNFLDKLTNKKTPPITSYLALYISDERVHAAVWHAQNSVTEITSLASIYTQRKVKPKLAMTGEITLRGKVLPVGGIKEKILAAKRAGIEEIILCKKNKKDIKEMKSEYTKKLTIHYVETVGDVLKIALLKEKVKKPIDFNIPPIQDLKKGKDN